jgi:hypothetical protein
MIHRRSGDLQLAGLHCLLRRQAGRRENMIHKDHVISKESDTATSAEHAQCEHVRLARTYDPYMTTALLELTRINV